VLTRAAGQGKPPIELAYVSDPVLADIIVRCTRTEPSERPTVAALLQEAFFAGPDEPADRFPLRALPVVSLPSCPCAESCDVCSTQLQQQR
jgi:hypothetical protein